MLAARHGEGDGSFRLKVAIEARAANVSVDSINRAIKRVPARAATGQRLRSYL